MNRTQEPHLADIDLPNVRSIDGHKRRLRAALLSAHRERSESGRFGYALNDIIHTMTTAQKGFAVSALALTMIVGSAGVFGPSATSVAHAQAQETINRAYARLANLSGDERAELFKHAHGDGARMALRQHDEAALAEILAEAQAASDLQIVSADELPIPGFFGRAGRAFGFKMTHMLEDSEKRLMRLPEGVREAAEGRMATEAVHKMPASFMVYTNPEGGTVYLGINDNDEPVFVLITQGDFPPEGARAIIKSERGGTPQDGEHRYLRSSGDALPAGEGKRLFNADGESITR